MSLGAFCLPPPALPPASCSCLLAVPPAACRPPPDSRLLRRLWHIEGSSDILSQIQDTKRGSPQCQHVRFDSSFIHLWSCCWQSEPRARTELQVRRRNSDSTLAMIINWRITLS